MKKNKNFRYKNQYYYIDNNSIKIQLVKKIDRSVESIKHIKITFNDKINDKINDKMEEKK